MGSASRSFVDETGRAYGRLLVLGVAGRDRSRAFTWRCRCECGREKIVQGSALRRGLTQSCGCLGAERRRAATVTHGLSQTTTYKSWRAMMGRCYEATNASHGAYGAQGIAVCARWHSFLAFLEDMGARPGGKTLDRIDNDLGYEPGNCRWATPTEQANNRRCNRLIEAFGERLTASQWADRFGITQEAIKARIRKDWPVELAVSRPIAQGTPRPEAIHGFPVREV